MKENTHILISKDLIQDIKNNNLKSIIEKNIDYYFLGSIFPDVFFHNKKYIHVSEKIHGKNGENTSDLILQFLEISKTEKSERDLAFVLGYISHYKVDVKIHPVIENLIGHYYVDDKEKQRKIRFKHRYLETILDIQLYGKDLLEKIKPRLVKKIKVLRYFPENQQILLNSYEKCQSNNKLFRSYFVYKILYFLIRFKLYKNKEDLGLFYSVNKKDLNMFRGELSYQNFLEKRNQKQNVKRLISEVKKDLVSIFEKIFDYYNEDIEMDKLKNFIRGENFDTGKINY